MSRHFENVPRTGIADHLRSELCPSPTAGKSALKPLFHGDTHVYVFFRSLLGDSPGVEKFAVSFVTLEDVFP